MVEGSGPGVKNSNTDLKRALRDKENKLEEKEEKLLNARLAPIEKTAEEAKEIALSAKSGWKNVKIASVIGFILFAVSAASVFFLLRERVNNNEKAVVEYKADMTTVKADMAEVKIDIQEVKVIVEESKKQAVKKNEKQLKEIKSVITEAFAAQEARPKRRQR